MCIKLHKYLPEIVKFCKSLPGINLYKRLHKWLPGIGDKFIKLSKFRHQKGDQIIYLQNHPTPPPQPNHPHPFQRRSIGQSLSANNVTPWLYIYIICCYFVDSFTKHMQLLLQVAPEEVLRGNKSSTSAAATRRPAEVDTANTVTSEKSQNVPHVEASSSCPQAVGEVTASSSGPQAVDEVTASSSGPQAVGEVTASSSSHQAVGDVTASSSGPQGEVGDEAEEKTTSLWYVSCHGITKRNCLSSTSVGRW